MGEVKLNAEDALKNEVTLYAAKGVMKIASDEDYQMATNMVAEVKRVQKRVTDFFEPIRKQARATLDTILARKKEMLTPLEDAEKQIKASMAAWVNEQNRIRREQEEAERKRIEEEAKKKLEEAKAMAESGDVLEAEFAEIEAETLQNVAKNVTVADTRQKANGCNEVKTWIIKSIDHSKVPCEFNGVMIRPVDERAVEKMIRQSKGNIQIPGVEFEETVSIRININ